MKTMTCNQLGGACEEKFQGETFEEIAEMSKQHGMAMFKQADAAHLKAMEDMKALMTTPEAFGNWYSEKEQEFIKLHND